MTREIDGAEKVNMRNRTSGSGRAESPFEEGGPSLLVKDGRDHMNGRQPMR